MISKAPGVPGGVGSRPVPQTRSPAQRGFPRKSLPNVGVMDVNLVLDGGQQAFLDVIEGLVQRNLSLIKRGVVKPTDLNTVVEVHDNVWRDGLAAAMDGTASIGTLTAWQVAQDRAKGTPAHIGIVGGIPAVITPSGVGTFASRIASNTVIGNVASLGFAGVGEKTGETSQWLRVSLDGDNAEGVTLIGDAIAAHNARMLPKWNLPPLYKSGVKYQVEGAPERWLDAQAIYRQGHDDCEGLSAWRAGELLLEGVAAGVDARKIEKPSKEMGGSGRGRLYHAVTWVNGPDGQRQYDDPSVRLGMPVPAWYKEYADKRRAAGKGL